MSEKVPTRRLRTDETDNHLGWRRPALWAPAYLDTDVLVAASNEAAVTMHGIACYPTGFAFELETVTRYEVEFDPEGEREFSPFDTGIHGEHATASFRIEYSNGHSGALQRSQKAGHRPGPGNVMISPGGGGGGDGHWSFRLWVRPLPPPGPVTFVCEWEPMGIPETRHEIDGDVLRAAAARVQRIFPVSRGAA